MGSHQNHSWMTIFLNGDNSMSTHAIGMCNTLPESCHLPSLHCTVIVFALDWESHKSLKHDRECLTELLECACFETYLIQWIQLAEVGWESDDKGFNLKRGWVVCIKSCATFSVLVWC